MSSDDHDSNDWDSFDPITYRDSNYASPRREDLVLADLTAKAFRGEPTGMLVSDVGTGSNLFPLICSLPQAKRQVAWEYGRQNVDWLNREVSRKTLDQIWSPFVKTVAETYGDRELNDRKVQSMLRSKLSIRKSSVFELPRREFDASTMFFCAESITDRPTVFKEACHCWTKSVQKGGRLVGAFMENSEGYRVGDTTFPALSIRESDLSSAFNAMAKVELVERIPVGSQPIRPGYSGMLFFRGRAN